VLDSCRSCHLELVKSLPWHDQKVAGQKPLVGKDLDGSLVVDQAHLGRTIRQAWRPDHFIPVRQARWPERLRRAMAPVDLPVLIVVK